MLALGEKLIHQDLAVVTDHLSAGGAVVVLVADHPAAAGVEHLVADQGLLVLVLKVLSVHDPPTRGLFVLEDSVCSSHRLLPYADIEMGFNPPPGSRPGERRC